MRLARVQKNGKVGLGVGTGNGVMTLFDDTFADIDGQLQRGADGQILLDAAAEVLRSGKLLADGEFNFLPPLLRPSKAICLGLNYVDHAAEGGFTPPDFPTLFARFPSGFVGHGQPMILPSISEKFDFEGEMVAILGRGGKGISEKDALDHVFGYSVFNDGSIRDVQLRTPQWTAGKNFDGTGAFGPWIVTADELPKGGAGLVIETRLNGEAVQHASTADMIFNVAQTIALLSSFMTLGAGDMLVMGTPAGVGFARTPQLFMKAGDVVEVEVESIGILRNEVVRQ